MVNADGAWTFDHGQVASECRKNASGEDAKGKPAASTDAVTATEQYRPIRLWVAAMNVRQTKYIIPIFYHLELEDASVV